SFVGGLAGQNGVMIPQIEGPPVASIGTITSSYANVAVTITGAFSAAGGLVGSNGQDSTITNSQAFGAVTSTANATAFAGGLVGTNAGTITSTTQPGLTSACAIGALLSCATGNVGAANAAWLIAGGLVGENSGQIERSFATGTVQTGDNGK